MNSTAKTILFWILILATAVLLYQVVRHESSGRALSSPKTVSAKNTEYHVIQVGTSISDVQHALETGSSNGWQFVAPVTENGTTTALIFKYEKK